jgi:diphthamide biosynthesis enzyme Dph1/Dph2-like protein
VLQPEMKLNDLHEVSKEKNLHLLFIGHSHSPLLTLWQWHLPNIKSTMIYSNTSHEVWDFFNILNFDFFLQFEVSTTSVYAALRKRLYLVECVRDARTVGIICGTVSVQKHASIIQKLKVCCVLSLFYPNNALCTKYNDDVIQLHNQVCVCDK